MPVCAACGGHSDMEYGVHRDGFDDGPEVWLCNNCGGNREPSLPELWAAIKARLALGARIDYVE